MRKPLLLGLLSVLLTACAPDYEDSLHLVQSAISGNTLLLQDETWVQLLGVADTPATTARLRALTAGQRVQVAFDEAHYPADTEPGTHLTAYVLTETGQSLNRLLLQGHPEALATEAVAYDSLAAFTTIATGQPMVASTTPATTESTTSADTETGYPVPADVSTNFNNLSDLVDAVDPAVLLIETDDSQDTGFFVGPNSLAVSNHHVFAGATSGRVTLADGRQLPIAEIVEDRPERDYVLFRVGGALGRYAYLRPAATTPRRASPVYVIGNPKGLERTFTTGVVSALRRIDQPGDLIQFDAAISTGSSGSPVFNAAGEVVGIATFKRRECENCNFAVNIRLLHLERFGESQ